jgi:hypothetical protein
MAIATIVKKLKLPYTNSYKKHKKWIITYFFQLVTTFLYKNINLAIRRIAKLNVPTINNNKYYSLY